jgi:hypothetical protein
MSQKSAVLVYIAVEVWNHGFTEACQLNPAAIISAIFVWGCGMNTRGRSAMLGATDSLQLAVCVQVGVRLSVGVELWQRRSVLKEQQVWICLVTDRTAATYEPQTQCTCDVTPNTFVQPLLLWKSSKYYILWVCICSLSYPACNAHAPCCHLWPAWLYNIFLHYLINGKIFRAGEGGYWTWSVCFDFLCNFFLKLFSF